MLQICKCKWTLSKLAKRKSKLIFHMVYVSAVRVVRHACAVAAVWLAMQNQSKTECRQTATSAATVIFYSPNQNIHNMQIMTFVDYNSNDKQ